MRADDLLSAFGVGFTRLTHFDESAQQDEIARHLDVSFRRTSVDARSIADVFPRVIELAEQPLLRTAPAPLLHLSGSVRAGRTEGRPDRRGSGRALRRLRHLPRGQDPPVLGARSGIEAPSADSSAASTAGSRPIRRSSGRDPRQLLPARAHGRRRPALQPPAPVREHLAAASACFSPSFVAPPSDGPARSSDCTGLLPARFQAFSALSRAQYLEVATLLQPYLLHAQGDRMLMGSSIEGRFPYLDYRVAEFAAALPDRLRLRGLEEKYALRRAAAQGAPALRFTRCRRRPYRAPIREVFAGPPSAGRTSHELLGPKRLARGGPARSRRRRPAASEARGARTAGAPARRTRWPSSGRSR